MTERNKAFRVDGEAYETTTIKLARRLETFRDHPAARKAAAQLQACATNAKNETGWRCGNALCPRCQRRAASKRRKAIEREVAAMPDATDFGLATFTLAADDITEGAAGLRGSLAMLRRRVVWSEAVDRGWGQIEVGVTGGRFYNVHCHLLVALKPGHTITPAALTKAWAELLGAEGRRGRTDYKPIPRADLFVAAREGADFSLFSPPAFYVSKKKRRELLDFSDEELLAFVRAIPGRKWSITIAPRGTRFPDRP